MSAEKVFLDANILFSVAYGSYSLSRLWDLSRKGYCVLLVSHYVIEEAKRNLTMEEQLNSLDMYLTNVRVVLEADPSLACPVYLPDKDKPVLMSAISAGADYFLTGDIVHFGRYFGKTIMGVKTLMARDYLNQKLSPEN